MGTPLPPNQPGPNCGLCWGPGKPFGDFQTPRFITVTLTGIAPGDDWNPAHEQLLLTPHLLDQVITPCDWDIRDGIFLWNIRFTTSGTSASISRVQDALTVFVANPPGQCQTVLQNQQTDPFMVVGINGILTITWDLEGL